MVENDRKWSSDMLDVAHRLGSLQHERSHNCSIFTLGECWIALLYFCKECIRFSCLVTSLVFYAFLNTPNILTASSPSKLCREWDLQRTSKVSTTVLQVLLAKASLFLAENILSHKMNLKLYPFYHAHRSTTGLVNPSLKHGFGYEPNETRRL